MYVLVLRVELHLPTSQSLKAKRSLVTPIVRHLDRMTGVGVAEVDHQDLWQRATLGVTVVGSAPAVVERTADDIDRYLWSTNDIDIIESERSWWEE
ncbi:MAG: DUF503 domain-containing protein [Acidimicrobiales bacterium]